MRRMICLGVVGSLLFATITHCAQRDDSVADDGETASAAARETIAYHTRSVPAKEIVTALRQLFVDDANVQVAEAPGGETVLVRCQPSSRDEVLKLLDVMDPAPRMIRIEALLLRPNGADTSSLTGPIDTVLEAINTMQRAGQVAVADRIRMTTIENQKTLVQVGQMRARVTGATRSAGGQTVKSYQNVNVGTLLSAIARIDGDAGIVMDLQFEKSELVAREPDAEDQDGVVSQYVVTSHQQTTIRVRDGEAMLVSGAESVPDNSDNTLLIVAVQIVKPGEAASASLLGGRAGVARDRSRQTFGGANTPRDSARALPVVPR